MTAIWLMTPANHVGLKPAERRETSMGDRSHEAIAELVEQLLEDPLVQLVMDADRVDRGEARTLLRTAALKAEVIGRDFSGEITVTIEALEANGFRKGTGVVLFNARGQVLVGERVDVPGAWQMPQGGIDDDEAPRAAAIRELREEIGTDRVEILSESKDWLTYELPVEVARRLWGGRWRGQQQKWFAMLFTGEDDDIDIATDHPEFAAWRWVSLHEAIELITPFKRHVYQHVAREFAQWSPSAAARP